MNIRNGAVVTMHYVLKDDTGQVIDASAEGEPLSYLHGHGNLVPGLERELEGKSAGDKLKVKVPAADGYGERDDRLIQRIPRRTLRGIAQVRVGMRLTAQTQQGPRPVTVTQIAGDLITIDGNHPLAGQNLNFEIEVSDVRESTAEELAHGHVHGPGDHHHHE